MQRCLPSQQVIQKSVCVVAFHPTGCPPRGVHAHVPQNVSLFLALLLACVHVLLHPIPQDGPHVVSTLLFLRMCLYFLLSYWRLCMCCCIPPHRMAPHVVSTLAILKMCLCLSLSSYGRVRVCAVASHFLWTCACLCCCLPLFRIAPHVVFTLMFLDALPKFEKKIGL